MLWLGIMSGQEGLDHLVDAAEHVVHARHRDDVHFAIVGPGDVREPLQRRVEALGLGDRVELPGMVDDALVRAYVSTADVCVGVDERNAMNDRAAMRKVLEYLALGKPVVQFPLAEMRRLCGDASVYARDGDAADLAERICGLLDDEAARLRLGAAARRRALDGLMWPQQVPALQAAVECALAHAAGGRMTRDRVTVVLAGDHAPTRLGIRLALERVGHAVVAEVATADAAVEAALASRPSICLLDLAAPTTGSRRAAAFATAFRRPRPSCSSSEPTSPDMFEALVSGASGYLAKTISSESLAAALAAVLEGEATLPRNLEATLIEEFRSRELGDAPAVALPALAAGRGPHGARVAGARADRRAAADGRRRPAARDLRGDGPAARLVGDPQARRRGPLERRRAAAARASHRRGADR